MGDDKVQFSDSYLYIYIHTHKHPSLTLIAPQLLGNVFHRSVEKKKKSKNRTRVTRLFYWRG